MEKGTLIMVTPDAHAQEGNQLFVRHGSLYRIAAKLMSDEGDNAHDMYACESLSTGEVVYWFRKEFIAI